MNNILQLKGQFQSQPRYGGGSRNLPVGSSVTSDHLNYLIQNLERLYQYWVNDPLIGGALIGVFYKQIVAKSNRVKTLLANGNQSPNESVRGAKFIKENKIKHVFTHYIGLDIIKNTIQKLQKASLIVTENYSGKVDHNDIELISKSRTHWKKNNSISKTLFINIIVDSFYVEKFDLNLSDYSEAKSSIISIFRTNIKTEDLFKQIGIDYLKHRHLNETTLLLYPDQVEKLKNRAPYLISMAVRDLKDIPLEEFRIEKTDIVEIPSPQDEPIIGVIDTHFSKDVYFKEWVTYENMLDPSIVLNSEDFTHGTRVTSIIVDGPTINPSLNDGCGRFRVKHFGVCQGQRFSSISILKSIRTAVSENRDIKVWNLSLGSALEISPDSISPEAAELDKIQCEFDVIFVVAGTNAPTNKRTPRIKIGAPADSLNALVVNSVTQKGFPASYHRVGPVLSFFQKPDVSYYGGDSNEFISVCSSTGEGKVCGTSYAAPWISRKLAYLISTLGFSKEVAKAMLIDSASGWNPEQDKAMAIGYGIVPIHIENIVRSPNDEIRFLISGMTQDYETYAYNIPVPSEKGKHPFLARATLCYFPQCDRDQGVDYTGTEMDIHFGRIKINGGKAAIVSINNNNQGESNCHLFESEAREFYRKWDNVKLICEEVKPTSRPRKAYGNGLWGLSIKTTGRTKQINTKGLPFGIVITLKELNGKNRIDDFIKACQFQGWIVNEIDINNRLDIYSKAEEEIIFE